MTAALAAQINELKAELAEKDKVIEKVRQNVMSYPNDGCTEGRLDFLKSCGIETPSPGTEYIWVGVCLKLTPTGQQSVSAGHTDDVLRAIEGLLDYQGENDLIEEGCSYLHEAHFVAEEGSTNRHLYEIQVEGDPQNPPRVYVPEDWA